MGLTDIEIPWDDLTPESRARQLELNRALFGDPDWLPPDGFMITQITIPAQTWDELFSDDETETIV